MQYREIMNYRKQTDLEWIRKRKQFSASRINTKRACRLTAVLAVSLLFLCLVSNAVLAGPPGPGGVVAPAVVIAPVVMQDIVPAVEYVGHVEAVQAVDLFAQVAGNIRSIHFKDGQPVKEGDLLFTIEQDLYKARFSAAEAALAQAKANVEGNRSDLNAAHSSVAAARADLDAARAAFERADKFLKRMRSVDERSIVQANLDAAESDSLQAQARVAQAKALVRQRESQVLQAKALLKQGQARILQAQADLDVARINLGYTEIRSPINGRIGKAAATKGNYVGPGAGPLARIVQMDPIRVVYSVSENDFAAIQKALADSERDTGRLLAPQLRLANGKYYTGTGHVVFVDNQVDPTTGTIAVRAVFDNPDGLLLPGQYVTVLVKAASPKLMPMVPQSAVQQDHEGAFVLIVDKDKRVAIRRVRTGPVVDVKWAVESGLAAGEMVVIQGVQKVRPGQTVKTVSAGEARGGH